MNLYLPWTTTQEKKSLSRNNSPDRTDSKAEYST